MNPGRDRGVPQTIYLTEQNFDQALVATQGLVLVNSRAERCGPCRAIASILKDLAKRPRKAG